MSDESPVSFVRYIAESLVRKPDAVQVDLVEADDGTVVELRVDENDMSRVIGRKGSVASSLRSLLSTFEGANNEYYILEIVE